MSRKLLALVTFLMVGTPVYAQDGPPPTIVFSWYKCGIQNLGTVGDVAEKQMSIYDELVDEGAVAVAGTLFHLWGDEYNFGLYRMASDAGEAIAANAEAARRFNERHAEEEGSDVLTSGCSEHKDAIYWMGPYVPNNAASGNPVVVSAMWKCDTDRIGEVIEEWETYSLPVVTAMQEEGTLHGAGTMVHQWADEFNVGFYWWAADIPSFLEARAEQARRVNTAQGEGYESPFAAICSEHKDNIYGAGPRTGMTDANGN